MPLCTDFSVVNGDSHEGEISMLRCKRWCCEICAPINAKRVRGIAARGHANAFMTLSCDPKHYETPAAAARDMKRGLVLLRRRIERKWGIKNMPFLVVFEKTKLGWPHMHLLIRCKYMHWKTLRGMWDEICGAYMVDIRRIPKPQMVWLYITKYMTKDLAAFEGCKRWWKSQNYLPANDDEYEPILYGSGFVRISVNFEKVQRILFAEKWDFELLPNYKLHYKRRSDTYTINSQAINWEKFEVQKRFL